MQSTNPRTIELIKISNDFNKIMQEIHEQIRYSMSVIPYKPIYVLLGTEIVTKMETFIREHPDSPYKHNGIRHYQELLDRHFRIIGVVDPTPNSKIPKDLISVVYSVNTRL